MSVMPELSAAAVGDPRAYIEALTAALSSLRAGSAHVRMKFSDDYLNFRAEDAGELRKGIVRLESLIATGQLPGRQTDIHNPMPWLRPR